MSCEERETQNRKRTKRTCGFEYRSDEADRQKIRFVEPSVK